MQIVGTSLNIGYVSDFDYSKRGVKSNKYFVLQKRLRLFIKLWSNIYYFKVVYNRRS